MPDFPQFATPHCHPQSLDSASTPAAFAARQVALGGKALTCTDHGTLQASQAIFALAKKHGLRAVVGLEAYFRDDADKLLEARGIPRTVSAERWAPKTPSYADHWKYGHLTLHFRDYDAYLCAVRLLSRADLRAEQHGSEKKPLFGWAEIEELAAHNVTAGSGCLIGMVQRHLLDHGDRDVATAYFDRLHHLFGDRFYAELFPHRCTHNWTEAVFVTTEGDDPAAATQRFKFPKKLRLIDLDRPGREPVECAASDAETAARRIGSGAALAGYKHYHRWVMDERGPQRIVQVRAEKGAIQNACTPASPNGDVQWGGNMYVAHLAAKRGVKVLVSDDSHFATPAEWAVQDTRLGRWRMCQSHHLQTSAEAWEYFSGAMGVKEAAFRGWIDNSLEWADGFKDFKFDTAVKLPSNFYPTQTLQHTADLISRHGRLSDDPGYRARLKEEIQLLHRNKRFDLLPYFMIDEEVCRIYRNQGWLTGPGRGSAAGLYLANLLGITHVDPLRYELSLARFMTPDRIESGNLPDIDQDLPFRWPLEGGEVDVVEFRADDGTVHVFPEAWRFETRDGLMMADQAAETGTPLHVWWRKAERATAKIEILRKSRLDPTLPRWFPGWLQERFGDHCAQMSVDATLKLRMSVKDVSRQRRGHVPPDIEEWTKQFEDAPVGVEEAHHVLGHDSAEGWIDGSVTRDKALQAYISRYPEDWEIVKLTLGLARHRSQHPCGFVIADRPISDFIPLQTVGKKRVTAYTAKPVEAVGGVKMDFLVVSSIHDIQEALELIRARHGLVPGSSISGTPQHHLVPLPDRSGNADIWDLPADSAVFGDFVAGRTETVFQYHTDGAVDWLRYFRGRRADGRPLVSDIRDLAVFTALDRPGPLDVELRNPDAEGAKHNALVEYTRRAAGRAYSPDIHPAVEKLLPETYGVIVFQEQVQKVFQLVTGCSGSEAEEFRRKVAKKEDEKLKAVKPLFIERAAAILGTVEDAENVWATLRTFAQYGFNVSHATCYAIMGYACAWLKRNYRLEWWCGLLRHADKEKINTKFWPHIGAEVALPDIGLSGPVWEIRGDRLQAPMTLLTGIGPAAHAQLCHYAPYRTVGDLASAIVRYREDAARIEATVREAAVREAAKRVEDAADVGFELPEDVALDQVQDEVVLPEPEDMQFVRDIEEAEAAAEKVKQPRSPIHRTIVYNLIVAGALESLFPPSTPVDEQLAAFDAAMLEKVGKKWKTQMKRAFPTLDTLARYQTRKKVLAPYGDDLRKLLPLELPESLERSGDEIVYRSARWDRDEGREVECLDALAPYETVRQLAEATELPEGGYRCAAIASLDSVRAFRWGENKASDGMEVSLEIGGGKIPATVWPPMGESKISETVKTDLRKGAIVVVVMHRNRPGKSFAIRDYSVVRPPLAAPEKKGK